MYFLVIEIARSTRGIVLSQKKYAMDILSRIRVTRTKSVDTPMEPNSSL